MAPFFNDGVIWFCGNCVMTEKQVVPTMFRFSWWTG